MILPFALACLVTAHADAIPLHLRAEAATDVPWDVGGRVVLEGPARLRLSAAAGTMPRTYVRMINETVIYFDGYDREAASIVEDALASSLVLRTHVGWRPLPRQGLYLQGGYGLVTLGGGVSAGFVLSEALDFRIPEWMLEGYEFDVVSSLHMVEGEVGWEGRIWRGLVWRAALGGTWTLDARTTIAPNFDAWLLDAWITGWCNESAGKLDEKYESFVRIPLATVGLGWRFF